MTFFGFRISFNLRNLQLVVLRSPCLTIPAPGIRFRWRPWPLSSRRAVSWSPSALAVSRAPVHIGNVWGCKDTCSDFSVSPFPWSWVGAWGTKAGQLGLRHDIRIHLNPAGWMVLRWTLVQENHFLLSTHPQGSIEGFFTNTIITFYCSNIFPRILIKLKSVFGWLLCLEQEFF